MHFIMCSFSAARIFTWLALPFPFCDNAADIDAPWGLADDFASSVLLSSGLLLRGAPREVVSPVRGFFNLCGEVGLCISAAASSCSTLLLLPRLLGTLSGMSWSHSNAMLRYLSLTFLDILWMPSPLVCANFSLVSVLSISRYDGPFSTM